jgi:hypothetical protein
MSLSDLTAAERHRRVAADLTALVERTTDWDAPTPVAGWTAKDVVGHLVSWLPGFLSAGGVEFASRPAGGDDPVATWTDHVARVQALLDDPASASATFSFEPDAASGAAGAEGDLDVRAARSRAAGRPGRRGSSARTSSIRPQSTHTRWWWRSSTLGS